MRPITAEQLVLLATLQQGMRTEKVISPKFLCKLYPYLSSFFGFFRINGKWQLIHAMNSHPRKAEIRARLDNYIDQWVGIGEEEKTRGRKEKELPLELTRAITDICNSQELIINNRIKHKGWNELFHSLEAAGISYQPNTVKYYVKKHLINKADCLISSRPKVSDLKDRNSND